MTTEKICPIDQFIYVLKTVSYLVITMMATVLSILSIKTMIIYYNNDYSNNNNNNDNDNNNNNNDNDNKMIR